MLNTHCFYVLTDAKIRVTLLGGRWLNLNGAIYIESSKRDFFNLHIKILIKLVASSKLPIWYFKSYYMPDYNGLAVINEGQIRLSVLLPIFLLFWYGGANLGHTA